VAHQYQQQQVQQQQQQQLYYQQQLQQQQRQYTSASAPPYQPSGQLQWSQGEEMVATVVVSTTPQGSFTAAGQGDKKAGK
jgi:transcription initiation factor TFIID subunit TAF12